MTGQPRTMAKRATGWQVAARGLCLEIWDKMPDLKRFHAGDHKAELWRDCARASLQFAEAAEVLAALFRERAGVTPEDLGYESDDDNQADGDTTRDTDRRPAQATGG